MKETKKKTGMSLLDMWNYLVFQTRGYRIIQVVIVLGALTSAAVVYVDNILYARILDALLEDKINEAVQVTIIMIVAVFLLEVISKACNHIFEHYILPSQDETKKRTARKAFTMEYQEIEKKETLSNFRRVRAGESGHGDISVQLRQIYVVFKEGCKIVFAVIFVLVLFASTNLEQENILVMIGSTAVLGLAFLGTLWVNLKISARVGKRSVQMNYENEEYNSIGAYIIGIIDNEKVAKDIRLYRMQNYLRERHKEALSVGVIYSKFGAFVGKNQAVISMCAQILAGFAYVYIAIKAVAGSVSTGEVLMYAGAIATMMTSIQTAFGEYNEINYSNEYLKVYEEFIQRPNMHYDGTLPIEKRDDNRYELSFSHVSFKYDETENYVLKDFSMKFNIGEKVALVGRNGAGKTTIIKLLLRLYEPTEGEILLNGINIAKYDYEEYVRIFSVVFQDFKLYDFPLDENIAGSEQVDSQRVKEVIRLVDLSDRVERMAKKEHSLLFHENGEGEGLSGGEAQKVAIARAIYKDAPFIILDEPTAALDPIAEAAIYENFNSLVGDKTAIFISHRMSSCKFCDRIVVVDHGNLAESGNHETLMQHGGIYANLYQTQAQYYQ